MAKRAASAYWLWLEENRTSLVQAHGLEGKKATEVSKKAGEVWKALDHTSKKKYEDLAAKDKQRYDEEVQTIGKRERMQQIDTSTGKKARRDAAAPKPPMSAFFMWVQDSRERAKSGRPGSLAAKNFSYEAWKSVTDAVRKNFEEKASLAKDKYKKDLDLYHLQRASCQDTFMCMHNEWNTREPMSGNDEKKSDVCECGEPLNGVRFCEQCGVENPHHKDASKAIASKIGVNQVETASDDLGQNVDIKGIFQSERGQSLTGVIFGTGNQQYLDACITPGRKQAEKVQGGNASTTVGSTKIGASHVEKSSGGLGQDADVKGTLKCEGGQNPTGVRLGAEIQQHIDGCLAAGTKQAENMLGDLPAELQGGGEEAVPTRQLATKEEILLLASSLERDEILWLCEQMELLSRNVAMSEILRVNR